MQSLCYWAIHEFDMTSRQLTDFSFPFLKLTNWSTFSKRDAKQSIVRLPYTSREFFNHIRNRPTSTSNGQHQLLSTKQERENSVFRLLEGRKFMTFRCFSCIGWLFLRIRERLVCIYNTSDCHLSLLLLRSESHLMCLGLVKMWSVSDGVSWSPVEMWACSPLWAATRFSHAHLLWAIRGDRKSEISFLPWSSKLAPVLLAPTLKGNVN